MNNFKIIEINNKKIKIFEKQKIYIAIEDYDFQEEVYDLLEANENVFLKDIEIEGGLCNGIFIDSKGFSGGGYPAKIRNDLRGQKVSGVVVNFMKVKTGSTTLYWKLEENGLLNILFDAQDWAGKSLPRTYFIKESDLEKVKELDSENKLGLKS